MRDYNLWTGLLDLLQTDQHAVLFLVVGHSGSTPGKTGFKMVISKNEQLGTIGGGTMEVKLVNTALEYLNGKINLPHISKIEQIHRKSADETKQSGLICAGEQTILRVLLDPKDKNIISQIVDHYHNETQGKLIIRPDSVQLSDKAEFESIRYKFMDDTNNWAYDEIIGILQRVYIFGGGHVGTAISQALVPLDFYCIINDNREELEMHRNNPYANEIRTGPYKELASRVREGLNTYIIIATYGFDFDFEVLHNVINKNVRYIGLMGSAAKLNKIFREIRELGIGEDTIEKIHAPIGIDLPNETAEEIAVSIVAELIKEKNS